MRARLKLQQQQSHIEDQQQQQLESESTSPAIKSPVIPVSGSGAEEAECESKEASQKQVERFGSGLSIKSHWLGAEIDRVCAEQLSYARQGVGEGGNGWQLFADEGEMKMYRREEEVNGMVIDPLKACHVVKGVSAREMCHYFYSPEFRNDWESE